MIKRFSKIGFLICIFTALFIPTAYADMSENPIPVNYRHAAISAGVPYKLLYALALQESNNPNDKNYAPWQWTLNIGGKSAYLDGEEEAVSLLKEELAKGKKNIDICAGQINYRWNGHLIPNIDDAFNLENCLEAATAVLNREFNYCEEVMGVLDWWCAIGRYHSPGKSDEQQRRADRYIARVKAIHEKLTND